MVRKVNHQRTDTGIGGLGNKKAIGDHPKYSILRPSKVQNTKKGPEYMRRLAVTQTLLEKQLLTLCVKN